MRKRYTIAFFPPFTIAFKCGKLLAKMASIFSPSLNPFHLHCNIRFPFQEMVCFPLLESRLALPLASPNWVWPKRNLAWVHTCSWAHASPREEAWPSLVDDETLLVETKVLHPVVTHPHQQRHTGKIQLIRESWGSPVKFRKATQPSPT